MKEKGTQSAWTAISDLIEKLGVDPCLLAIVVIVFASYWLVVRSHKHVENMEQIRMAQIGKAFGDPEKLKGGKRGSS
jgi:hypothetical protein